MKRSTAHEGHADGHDEHDDHAPTRHRHAKVVSIVGTAVLWAAFGLAASIFGALSGAHAEVPFVKHALRVDDRGRSALSMPRCRWISCRW